jgi:GT2 family glycosyltransferase
MHKSNWPVPFDFAMQVRQENCIPACTIFRKEAWLRAGGYRQQYAPCEDAELWLRIVALGYKAIMATSAPTYMYRLHDQSATKRLPQTDWAADKPWYSSVNNALFGSVPSDWVSYPVRNYDQPWVSVIIPVGPDHEHLISRAIDSVWLQDMPYWQVIVVNDSGNNLYQSNTMLPLKEAYPFIELYTTAKPGSKPAVARNLGAKHAKADFLLFLDADDGLLMECLREMMQAYNDNNGEYYVYSDWYSYDGKNRHIHETGEFDVKSLWAQALHPITALIPKAWFDEVGGFDEALPGWEDWELFIKIAKKHCGVRVPLPLMTYDISAGKKREEDYANLDKSLAAIRAKHKESEMCVTCKDKGRPAQASVKSESKQPQVIAAGNEVLVQDNSGNKGMHGAYGIKTGRNYGGKVHGEQFTMAAADQKMQPHLYIMVANANAAAVQRPVEKPLPPAQPVAPPPQVVMPSQPVAQPVEPIERKVPQYTQAVAAEPEPVVTTPAQEYEVDLSMFNALQIRNMGIDKETAAMAVVAEKAGLNRPDVLMYLEKVASG